MLEKDKSLKKQNKLRLKTIKISCRMLNSFLLDLVDWTQIKLGKFSKKEENFNCHELFEIINEMIKFKADLKHIYSLVDLDQNLPVMVFGDHQRLA